MILSLMMLAVGQGAGPLRPDRADVHVGIGRISHPIGLRANAPTHALRIAGNSACILATLTLIAALTLVALGVRT